MMIDRVKEFKHITETMASTYEAKNHDYGNSFELVRNKFPAAILVRLNDKLSRIETLLMGKSAKVTNESIDDTLLDLAVYCIMELVAREQDKEYLRIYEASKVGDADVQPSTCTHRV
jgi:glutaredoxin 2